MTFENATFREQLLYMSNHDILVSLDGAQLWCIPFMPPCSGILEIFPRAYWHGGYGTMALDAGLKYMSMRLSANHGAGVPTWEEDFYGTDEVTIWNHRWHARLV